MESTMKDVLIALVSGSVGAAVIKMIGDGIAWRRNRKATKEDREDQKREDAQRQAAINSEERLKEIEKKTDAQSVALRFLLYDRIRHLGQSYIAAGEIDFDDRRILNEMHKSYHFGLDGNGDLDNLMKEVNRLPLKLQK